MGKIIAIANQKGGVGKTTTAINLSSCISELEKKVLLIDMDPQSNTTSGYGIERSSIRNSVYELIMGECTVRDAVISLDNPKMDLIAAVTDLAGAEIELIDYEDKEFRLKTSLENVKDEYDYIFLDCPPSLSMITVNCLTAADSVLIPMQAEYYALEGLALLVNTIEMIRERLNPNLHIEGILFTMYDGRTRLSQEIVENVKENLNVKIYETIIPRNVRLAEAPSYGMPINLYDNRSKGSKRYMDLAAEILNLQIARRSPKKKGKSASDKKKKKH